MAFHVYSDGYDVSENGNCYYKIKLRDEVLMFEKGSCTLDDMKRKIQEHTKLLPPELEDQLWRIEVFHNKKRISDLKEVDEAYDKELNERVEYQMRQNCVPGAMDGRSFHLERQMFFSAHGQAYGYEHPGIYTPYGDQNPNSVENRRQEELRKITGMPLRGAFD